MDVLCSCCQVNPVDLGSVGWRVWGHGCCRDCWEKLWGESYGKEVVRDLPTSSQEGG